MGNVHVMDFRNSLSAISLLKATSVFESLQSSEFMEVRGLEADVQDQLIRVLPPESCEKVSVEKTEDGLICMVLRKL